MSRTSWASIGSMKVNRARGNDFVSGSGPLDWRKAAWEIVWRERTLRCLDGRLDTLLLCHCASAAAAISSMLRLLNADLSSSTPERDRNVAPVLIRYHLFPGFSCE